MSLPARGLPEPGGGQAALWYSLRGKAPARPAAERRKTGKTDRLDAYRAARSVLSGEATTDPKAASIEPLRALTVTRRSAVKAQQAAWRQIGALLVNAPSHLRDRYRHLTKTKLVAALIS